MRVLFDSNTPAPLAFHLKGHVVTRTGELGWQSWEDGALLDAAEKEGFDLLLTCDQNIRYQQNFSKRRLAILILSTNHWPSIRKAASQIAIAVDFVQRASVSHFEV